MKTEKWGKAIRVLGFALIVIAILFPVLALATGLPVGNISWFFIVFLVGIALIVDGAILEALSGDMKEILKAVETRSPREQKLANVQTQERLFCRYCGSDNKKDAVFCQKCGKPIE